MNSFKAVYRALEYEVERQCKVLEEDVNGRVTNSSCNAFGGIGLDLLAGRVAFDFGIPAGGIEKGVALICDGFRQVMIIRIDQQEIQAFFMIRTASGGCAKTAAAWRVAGQSDKSCGFVGADPVGILIIGCVEIFPDQDKGLGVTGPNADDSLGRIVFVDFLHDMMIILGFIQGIFKHRFGLGINNRFG